MINDTPSLLPVAPLLETLSHIADRLESTQDLDVAVQGYEEAVIIGRQLHNALHHTEQRIEQLDKDNPW
ncbi:hypothetical protein EBZ35_00010 [bacterium]|nr:hypothetical protein [bacterium]